MLPHPLASLLLDVCLVLSGCSSSPQDESDVPPLNVRQRDADVSNPAQWSFAEAVEGPVTILY